MTILTFPAIINPSQVLWRLLSKTQVHESPFSGAMQTLRQPAERWAATLTWNRLTQSDWRLMSAFLAQLNGQAGRFYYGPVHAPRLATGSGTPAINGSVQTGSTISIDGWGASAQAFKAGDYFSYNDANGRPMLYIVTADISATGAGVANVPVAPQVRRSVADGTAVEITSPVAVFRLASDDMGLTNSPGPWGSVSIDIIEALV